MSTTNLLAFLLRKGVIPLCSSAAACCFGLYSAKMSHAADLWASSLVDHDNNNGSSDHKDIDFVHRHYRESVQHYVVQLRQHSGACLWMSLSTAAMAMEAYRDWQHYGAPSSASWEQVSLALWQRQRPRPFFLRNSVVAVSAGTLALSYQLYGGLVFWQPESPYYLH